MSQLLRLSQNLSRSSQVSNLSVAGFYKLNYSTKVAQDDGYLHRSIVPTDHFQYSLPRLPVPDLEKTCERYLATQGAFLEQSALDKTRACTEEFRSGVGKDLQETLKTFDKANRHTSYITDFWFDMYFRDRRPVVLNHNPFMSFKPTQSPELMNPLIRATNFIVSSMRYCRTYRANILEPEIFHMDPAKSDTDKFRNFVRRLPKSVAFYGAYWYKAFPLDMSQFPSLFNSTRIPHKGKDRLLKDETQKHIVVMRNGNFYTFDCLDRDGNIKPASEIMVNLKYIIETPDSQPSHPVSFLSSMNRDSWAEARNRLLQNGNQESLHLLDTALFCLCLDSKEPSDLINLSRSFLHGDGVNRWYDKSFSLIMAPSGESAVNFEHSWGDGVAVMSYFNAVYHDGNNNPAVQSEGQIGMVQPSARKLEFNLSEATKADIECARRDFNAATDPLQLNFIEYTDGLGKKEFKRAKLGPDSMMQLALQLAYKRCYDVTPSTYESCSTSAFKHGRTETIRPATDATNHAVDLFLSRASASEILAALHSCSKTHNELTKNAAMGQGWDRHLFALRHFAEEADMSVPLFEDPAYKDVNTITLSTSTLSSAAVEAGGFAPVVPHGLGVGYGIHDERLGTIVTAYKPHKNPNDFLSALRESFNDIRDVLASAK